MGTITTKKHLECLYAWSEFYSKNQQWTSWDKVQEEIAEFKLLNGLD